MIVLIRVYRSHLHSTKSPFPLGYSKIRARWNRNPLYGLWAINAVEKGCARTFSMRKPVCTPLAERDQTETINADRNGMEANELGKQHGKRGS